MEHKISELRQMLSVLSQLDSENVVAQPSVLLWVGLKNKFKIPNFLFSRLWVHVVEKMECGRKFVAWKFFGQIW